MGRKNCRLKYDKNNLPLRIYFSSVAVKTVYLCALLTCVIVTSTMHLYYRDVLDLWITLILVLVEVILSLHLGGHWLMVKARKIVEPMESMNQAMGKVTHGNFETQIIHGNVQIQEINSMINNFNTMTQALKGMEYMNKEFISNVSHEVKTPISAIVGLTEILKEGLLPEEEQKEYVGLVHEEAVRLSRLSENMLRLSKLDNQTIVMKSESVNVTEQIRRCIILLNEQWEEKELEYEIDMDDITLDTDPDLLHQVWINLLNNAMKYSKGQTTIHVTGQMREDDTAVISIRDEGPGIPEEKLPHIFERFYQCEESHQKQGTGLGLSIVERIMQILQGRIECESQVGVGTNMRVYLQMVKNRNR